MNVHILGIGGAGMSAVARMLKSRGYAVTGDDRAASPVLDALRAEGIPCAVGHDPAHLDGVDAVAPSSAVSTAEPELAAARARGIPVWHRGDVLAMLMQDRVGVAVAGTHGKSTTTGMLATLLTDAGLDPSFIIGATPLPLGVNARDGRGEVFVVEADEYDRTFLRLQPRIAVVTNVEFDHPDTYRDLDDAVDAFARFLSGVPSGGAVVACADDPGAAQALKRAGLMPAPASAGADAGADSGADAGADARADAPMVIDYGLHRGAWRAFNLRPNPMGGVDFAYTGPGGLAGTASLRVPGEHNALNALAALAVCEALGLPVAQAAQSLGAYLGAGRRFELRGERRGVRVFDDYAHHPTEIRATLRGARMRYPVGNLWAVWQPHTYSRTIALLDDFATAFGDADHVIVLPVYAARERAEDFGFAATALNPIEISRRIRHRDARSAASLGDALGMLISQARGGDVVITLSAGDGNLVGERLLEMLR